MEAVRILENLEHPQVTINLERINEEKVEFEAVYQRDDHPRAVAKGALERHDQNDTTYSARIIPQGLLIIVVLEFMFTMVGVLILVGGMILLDMPRNPLIAGAFFLLVVGVMWRGIASFNRASGVRYDDAGVLSQILRECYSEEPRPFNG